jgi:hypothetical protein
MRNIIWFFALLILIIIKAGVLLPLHITPVNLILVVVAMATILSEFNQGLIITIMGGLLLDFVSGSPDGILSMSLIVVFLVMHLILREFLSREPNRFVLSAAVAGSTIIFFLAYILVSELFGLVNLAPVIDLKYLFSVSLPLTLMWNLIFAYFIFYYYSFVQNLVSRLPSHEEPIRT